MPAVSTLLSRGSTRSSSSVGQFGGAGTGGGHDGALVEDALGALVADVAGAGGTTVTFGTGDVTLALGIASTYVALGVGPESTVRRDSPPQPAEKTLTVSTIKHVARRTGNEARSTKFTIMILP